ncbi:hypothetical protein FEM48_Zijuj06G0163500 [Ziziphus jujuba var. spinosa]|uniref:Uncharacterized protein n=1 Tax=Ziziphus jujuba var. spinosa TaxID=714518 RepID=A0A978VAC1_ZIZJJ|nr:hypothetical protein FEM48_Zijuj06G0163500 [Ziziphus jujuba var. spinosa]
MFSLLCKLNFNVISKAKSSTMAIQNLHNKYRYLLNSSNPYFLISETSKCYIPLAFLPKNTVFPVPTSAIFFNSIQFHSKSTFIPLNSLNSSSGSSSVCAPAHPSSQSSHLLRSCGSFSDRGFLVNLRLLKPSFHGGCQSLSTLSSDISLSSMLLESLSSNEDSRMGNPGSDRIRWNATPKQVSEIIDMIRRGENDLESKLDSINVSFSVASVFQIFGVLNCEKVSALRFFDWIRGSQPNICSNYDVCSLVIDNCGRLNDFEAMLSIMNGFAQRGIRLTQKAFGFLTVLILDKPLVMDSVRKVVRVLNEVGGSCGNSGVQSLIEMFSILGSFEMAKFVIQMTERKVSYYYMIIREKCRRCDFVGAMAIIDEMRQLGCEPTVNIYNYILSTLFKNNGSAEASKLLKEMEEKNCPPDELTFEILICHSCKLGEFVYAKELLDGMVSRGLEPRVSTHVALVKAYFDMQRYEEAYNYVVDTSLKHRYSSNMIYSVLISLHQKKGNVVTALSVLSDMTKKGLRPNFSVYRRLENVSRCQAGI